MDAAGEPAAGAGGGRPKRNRNAPGNLRPGGADAGGAAGGGLVPPAGGAPGAGGNAKRIYFAGELKSWVYERCKALQASQLEKPLAKDVCAAWAQELKATLPLDSKGLLLRAACTQEGVWNCANKYREAQGLVKKRAPQPADGAPPKPKKTKAPLSEAEIAAADVRRAAIAAKAADEARAAREAEQAVLASWAALQPRAQPYKLLPVSEDNAEDAGKVFAELDALFHSASSLVASRVAQDLAVAVERLLTLLATRNSVWPWAAAWNLRHMVQAGAVPEPALTRVQLPPAARPGGGARRGRADVPQKQKAAREASQKAAAAMIRSAGTAVLKSSARGAGVLDATAAAAAVARHGFVQPAAAVAGAAGAAPAVTPPAALNGGVAFACYVSPDNQMHVGGFNFPAGVTPAFKAFMRELMGAPPVQDPAATAAALNRRPFTAEDVETMETEAAALGGGAGGAGSEEEEEEEEEE